MDEYTVEKVVFIREQDGPPEVELKTELVNQFKSFPDLERAYLVLVSYDPRVDPSVALCLRYRGEPNIELVKRIKVDFRRYSVATNTST